MNIEVKRAFVLADWMKAAQRCESEEEFLTLLAYEEGRVRALREIELDQIIRRDESRLKHFEESQWTLEEVTVADCFVWEGMGNRPWAVGTVREAGASFLRMEAAGSRIWKMKLFAQIFAARLPLIVLRRDGRLTIDDGSHRAVAMQLAGIKKTKAYVEAQQRRA